MFSRNVALKSLDWVFIKLIQIDWAIWSYIEKIWNKRQWNFNQNSNIFFRENALEHVVCETAVILSRPLCVKQLGNFIPNVYDSGKKVILHRIFLISVWHFRKSCGTDCQHIFYSKMEVCNNEPMRVFLIFNSVGFFGQINLDFKWKSATLLHGVRKIQINQLTFEEIYAAGAKLKLILVIFLKSTIYAMQNLT